jgi:hypothetical protein
MITRKGLIALAHHEMLELHTKLLELRAKADKALKHGFKSTWSKTMHQLKALKAELKAVCDDLRDMLSE